MSDWTDPQDILAWLQRRWDAGELLAARVTGAGSYPLELRLRQPKARDITERFGDVMDWARQLQAASSAAIGHGYTLHFETRRSRVQGEYRIPVAALVTTETDALRLLRRGADMVRFERLAETTLARFPELQPWVAQRPLQLLAQAPQWDRILAVLDWFQRHPRPGVYLRQLEIPGVDSKFIEQRRALFTDLLDHVLPDDAVDTSATGIGAFARRYGLAADQRLIRFRILDRALHLNGLSDLSVLAEEFAALDLGIERVFVTENRVNGLAFPEMPRSIVIFGLGYGLETLARIPWLRTMDMHYWGDIDTHGFGILNRFRATFPHARSLLMDRATLLAHRALWGQEDADKRYRGVPTRLTYAEHALFEELAADRLGERVRLEQERIDFGALRAALDA
ncbi:MAG: hypothetical protein JJU27_16230 [Gammaproteobacteria bacterium]|nr:hypothetical protein [Gammaproteobacteria bacterium]MCC5870051.1 hypothetical protein [Gammaproteobacteria bacterium]TVQ50435.1 MAG: hypothetical protein EA371_00540 [Gammaproteobacteria bacterium]